MTSFAFWEPILVFAMINAIVALGLYVTMMSGQLSMAHGALMGTGAYAAGVLTTNFHWPFPLAIVASMLLAAAIATVLSVLTSRMSELVCSLATLGFGESMSVVAYNIDYIGGAASFTGLRMYTTPPVALAALLLAIYLVWRFEGSRLAFAARAVRDSPIAAAANGVNVLWVRVVTFAFGAALAAFGGALAAHYTLLVNPSDLGFFQSLSILIFVLFGGSYTMAGPIVGAATLTILPQALRFSAGYRFVVYGLVIVLTILWRPQGLVTRIPTGDKFRMPRWGSKAIVVPEPKQPLGGDA